MTPSLSRNKSFSYLVSQSHPTVRQAIRVPQFSRRDVVRRLRLAVGAEEIGGGEHPKVILRDGKKVSVPGHRDLPRGTTHKIIRDAGIPISLTHFMTANDAELRRLVVAGTKAVVAAE